MPKILTNDQSFAGSASKHASKPVGRVLLPPVNEIAVPACYRDKVPSNSTPSSLEVMTTIRNASADTQGNIDYLLSHPQTASVQSNLSRILKDSPDEVEVYLNRLTNFDKLVSGELTFVDGIKFVRLLNVLDYNSEFIINFHTRLETVIFSAEGIFLSSWKQIVNDYLVWLHACEKLSDELLALGVSSEFVTNKELRNYYFDTVLDENVTDALNEM